MMQITYQKGDGSVIQRLRNTVLPYKIGETTSMGWKVLNIEYEYNNKFYSEYDYTSLINKKKQKIIRKNQARKVCVEEFKKFMYYIVAAIIINYLKMLLGL